MRYSVSTLAFPGIPVAEVIPLCAELGLDGVDLRTDYDGEHIRPDMPPAERRSLLDAVRSHGLVISGLYSYAGRAPMVSPDPAEREQDITLAKQVVDLAVDLECPLVRLFTGTRERTQENYERFIAGIRKAGEYAQQAGVQIGLETHAELIYDAASARRIIDGVALPNVVIIWDPANLQRAGTNAVTDAPAMWPMVRYIQLKDWLMRPGATRHDAVLMGKGQVDLAGLIAFIKTMHFDGWISLEYEKKWHPELPDARTGLAHDLAFLKSAFEGEE